VETLMLLVDSVAMALIVYWSLRNDRLAPGKVEEGWFRIADPPPPAEPKTQPRHRDRRGL
jgi:hypothetical protein